MKRRVISLFLSLAIILTCVGLPVFSENIPAYFGALFSENSPTDNDIITLDEPDTDSTAASEEELTEELSEEITETPTETPTEETDNVSEEELTEEPTAAPAEEPTEIPAEEADNAPAEEPTAVPTEEPTAAPTEEPIETPSIAPAKEIIKTFAGEASDITEQLKTQSVTITEDGAYTVKDLEGGTFGIVIDKGVSATINLDNAEIVTASNASFAPITIKEGAGLVLNLSGTNTITSSVMRYAGIAVCAESAEKANETFLKIEGAGTLNVTGGIGAPAIGSNRSETGVTGINGLIEINGGIINAVGGINSPGIGNAFSTNNTPCGDIVINDGYITVTSGGGEPGGGGQSPVLGGAATSNPNGDIYINGGYIKAINTSRHVSYDIGPSISADLDTLGDVIVTGGSIDAIISSKCAPYNTDGEELVMRKFSVPDAQKGDKFKYNDKNVYTDENGQLYFYIPADTQNIAVEDETTNTLYYSKNISEDSVTVMDEYTGGPCVCDDISNATVSIDLDEIIVNRLEATVDNRLYVTFHEADGCTYPIHPTKTTYKVEMADGSQVDTDKVSLNGNLLTVDFAMVGSSIRVSAETIMNGYTFTDEKVYTVQGDLTSNFDLAKGAIVISNNDDDDSYHKVTHGTSTFYVPKGDTINVYQSSNETPTRNNIVLRDEATISITDINIRTYSTDVPIRLTREAKITLVLNGTNNIESTASYAMHGFQDSSDATIMGDGTLNIITTAEGSRFFGLGAFKNLTINSGTINVKGYENNPAIGQCTLIVNGGVLTAEGGTDSAGIGGGNDQSGITVIVNDGRVYAYGKGNAAGIGGGSHRVKGDGGDFTINGGYVYAESEGTGMGIGYGGNTRSPGTITVNGGSVYTKNANKSPSMSVRPQTASPEYQFLVRVSLEDISDQRYVTYSIGDDDTKIPSSTDENGLLYLYLPMGYQWIRVYTDDGETYTYYRYKKVETNDVDNNFVCIKNPQVSITKFDMPGKVEEAGVENPVIDNENRRVTVKVPYNIELSNIELNDRPTNGNIAYTGAYASPTRLNFDRDETTGTASATYTIYGDDKVPVNYTIILELANAPAEDAPDVYDLSNGTIKIFGHNVVNYGGVNYRYNPLGYIITTSTGDCNGNYIAVDMGIGADMSLSTPPPITFDNLTLHDMKSGPGCSFYTSADVYIKGECNFTAVDNSKAGAVMSVQNSYNFPEGTTVKFYGDGILNITGNSSVPCVGIGQNATLEVSKNEEEGYSRAPSVAFVGDDSMDAVTKYGASATIGKMVTDGSSAMRLTLTDSPLIRPTNKSNEPLYQLSAKIDTKDHSISSCTYDGNTYHLWDDSTLYLMVPNGDYDLTDVEYGTNSYSSEETPVTVSSADAETTLYTVRVDSVSYRSGLYSSTDSEVDFTVSGTLIQDNVSILLQPDNGSSVIKALIENSDGTVTIPLDENPSPYDRVTYTVYYQIEGESPVRLTNAIIVDKNRSIRQITDIAFDNQIEEKATFTVNSDGRNIFTLTLPYDEEFPAHKSYTPKSITTYPEGLAVRNDSGSAYEMPTLFTLDVGGFMRGIFTVVAQNNSSTTDYIVQLFKQATPKITSFSFTQPTNPDGETISVTTSGTSINHIRNAVNEDNRKVFLYLDDDVDNKVEATRVEQANGADMYIASVPIPKNNSDRYIAEHTLKAMIGDVEQPAVSTVYVPRQERALTGIDSFTIDDQLGETVYDEDGVHISIMVPYDVDLTNLTPNIRLRDEGHAQYSPDGPVDFTNDVTFTVTAENGITTSDYIVHVENEPTPQATSIEFTNPEVSAAGRVKVKINGTNLDNTYHAVNKPKTIRVDGKFLTGSSENSRITPADAVYDEEDDCYYATIIVPPNNDKVNDRTYELTVTIGDAQQTLAGNTTLTVPKKEAEAKNLSDIIIAEGQSSLAFSKLSEINGNEHYGVNITVPYNTNISHVQPQIYHNGEDCQPGEETYQNFDYDLTGSPVVYTITSESGKYNTYDIYVRRSGSAKITKLAMNKPVSFKDTEINFDILGQFVPNLTSSTDVLELTVTRAEDSYQEKGIIVYDDSVYGGHATCTVNLPVNYTTSDKIYNVEMTVNGISQNIGSSATITVPRRSSRSISRFIVNGQIDSEQITETENDTGNAIKFVVPYEFDLTKITPIVLIDGTRYTPTGEQNFDGDGKPSEQGVLYTVYDEPYDTPRTYTVTAERSGLPSIYSVDITNQPDTFIGGTIDVDVSGVFFYDMKVKAVPVDGVGEDIEGVVDKTNWQWHHASAKITLGRNDSYETDKEYKLVFYLDNFEDAITYTPIKTVSVPKRKTKAITSFTIPGQTRPSVITDTDVYVWVSYGTDISKLAAEALVDGDDYSPKGGTQDFHNKDQELEYTVTAKNDDEGRKYKVHVIRDGKPTITYMSFLQPGNFQGGKITLNIEGVFFYSLQVFAAPVDGNGKEVEGEVTFNEGSATATVAIPPNTSTTDSKIYRLRFVVDKEPTSYTGGTEIIVPRRKTREITEFTTDIQESVEIVGTNINIDVPYNANLTGITPSIVFDADEITPEGPQDFSDLDNPVKYTLTASGDTPVTYTVNVNLKGHDPFLNSISVPDIQVKDTEYDPTSNLYSIVLKSNANLRDITPVLDYDGVEYEPTGSVDFSTSKTTPVEYTLRNEYGVEHKFNVQITKKSSGSSGGSSGGVKATPSPSPTPSAEPEVTASPQPSETPEVTEPTPTPDTTDNTGGSVRAYMSGYEEDGVLLFKPDNTVTRAEVSKILAVLDESFDADVEYPNVFADVSEDAWYRNYINFAASAGYISGYEDGTCQPDNKITRAEFASMLARFSGIQPDSESDRFNDLYGYDWCSAQINTLADMGVVSGYEDGSYRPGNNVTRAEVVSMINRLTNRNGQVTAENPFADVFPSHWAYNDILIASCGY